MLTSNKMLREILADAETYGWVFTKSKRRNHIKGKHPSGKMVTVGATPSDFRAINNIKAHLRVIQDTAACT